MTRFLTSAAAAALLVSMAGVAAAAPAAIKKPSATATGASAPVATGAARPAPAAANLPPITHGPVIPGMCVYADDRAVGSSTVGKAAAARMQQLRAQVTAELQAEQTGVQTDAAALKTQQPTLTPEQFQAKAAPIQARYDALNAKAAQRQRELEATGAEALQQIHQRVDTALRAIYQQRGCSILLNGESAYIYAPSMDLTDLVVAQLNTTLPTITFERKVLPPQPAQ